MFRKTKGFHFYFFHPIKFEILILFFKKKKMKITEKLLKIWYKKKDKVLVFTHSKKMLDIFERFAKSNGWSFFFSFSNKLI